MKVVVTGAAGDIGAATVARLLEAGHTVRGLDCLRFGGAALAGSYLTGRFTLTRGDIRDPGLVAEVLAGTDAVIHLAGVVGDPACAAEPGLARACNLDATVALHDAATRAGAARFVFASTCSVYGHCDHPADETAPLHPLSLYARTKAGAEAALLGQEAGGMATTVLRFATVYGLAPRMRFALVVNIFTAHALTTRRLRVDAPRAWRPFVHVADVAGAITAVVQAHLRRGPLHVLPLQRRRHRQHAVRCDRLALAVAGQQRLEPARVPGPDPPVDGLTRDLHAPAARPGVHLAGDAADYPAPLLRR